MYLKTIPFFLHLLVFIYCRNLVELLEANLTMLWGPPYDWAHLKFLNSDLSTPSLQQLIRYSSGFPTQRCFPWWFLLVSPCSGKVGTPCVCLSAPSWDTGLPCYLPSLMGPRRVDFWVCSAFYSSEVLAMTSKLLPCGTGHYYPDPLFMIVICLFTVSICCSV